MVISGNETIYNALVRKKPCSSEVDDCEWQTSLKSQGQITFLTLKTSENGHL